MGICLNMIVKDEAPRLPRLLASVASVADACVVADTGSSDDTPDIIRAWAGARGIPCLLTRHPWSDFATNRNLALEDARRARERRLHDCRWAMVIDADEELQVLDDGWRAVLRPGTSYALHVRSGGMSVLRPFLLDITATDWRWRGRVHNWAEASSPAGPPGFLSGLRVLTRSGGAKSHPFGSPREKASADRDLLLEELAGARLTASHAHRWVQLAHACLLAGRAGEAAERMSALLPADVVHPELRYAAAVLGCRAGRAAGLPAGVVGDWLDRAVWLAPHRWEAPYYRCLLHREAGQAEAALSVLPQGPPPPLAGTFWMEHDVYEWKSPFERAFLLHQLGRRREAAALAAALLADGTVPDAGAGFLRALLGRMGVAGGREADSATDMAP